MIYAEAPAELQVIQRCRHSLGIDHLMIMCFIYYGAKKTGFNMYYFQLLSIHYSLRVFCSLFDLFLFKSK